MQKAHLYWSHGMDAAPWGAKSKAMAAAAQEAGLTLDALDYRDTTDPDERTARLVKHIGQKQSPVILAGSSMGGYVSAAAAGEIRVAGLFLIAPALYLPGYEKHMFFNLPGQIEIVHGWNDDVVPVDNSVRFAKLHKATLHILPADHRMTGMAGQVASLFTQFLQGILT